MGPGTGWKGSGGARPRWTFSAPDTPHVKATVRWNAAWSAFDLSLTVTGADLTGAASGTVTTTVFAGTDAFADTRSWRRAGAKLLFP
jgi:hypothetical protein